MARLQFALRPHGGENASVDGVHVDLLNVKMRMARVVISIFSNARRSRDRPASAPCKRGRWSTATLRMAAGWDYEGTREQEREEEEGEGENTENEGTDTAATAPAAATVVAATADTDTEARL